MTHETLEVTARDGTPQVFNRDNDGQWWAIIPYFARCLPTETALCDALLAARRADDTHALALEALADLRALVEWYDAIDDSAPHGLWKVVDPARALLASDLARRLRQAGEE